MVTSLLQPFSTMVVATTEGGCISFFPVALGFVAKALLISFKRLESDRIIKNQLNELSELVSCIRQKEVKVDVLIARFSRANDVNEKKLYVVSRLNSWLLILVIKCKQSTIVHIAI